MSRRAPARAGLSYFDANRNRLITEGPDVLEVKQMIHARWPGVLECLFDTYDEEWVIIEHCGDGVDRHVLSTKMLTPAIYDKLLRLDQATHAVGDVARKLELEADKAEKDKEHALSEVMGEPIERFEHALRGAVLPFNKIIVNDGKFIKAGAARVPS